MKLLDQWIHALIAIFIYCGSVGITIYLGIKLIKWLFI